VIFILAIWYAGVLTQEVKAPAYLSAYETRQSCETVARAITDRAPLAQWACIPVEVHE
jgi:hypothetical protein